MTAGSERAPDDYRAIGEWYDAEHDLVVDDVALFLQLAEVIGDPILELGCGSGRILAPLVDAGWSVAGIDRSAPMLARARARLDALDATDGEATLILGAMTELPPELVGRHGLVILSHNTLLHAASPEAQRAVLATARAALDPRGMLVVDVINPLADARESTAQQVVLEGSWQVEGGGWVSKLSARQIDEAAQSIATTIWYDLIGEGGALTRTTTSLALRYVTAPELLLMLELAGYVDPLLYGSYDLDPYTASSPRLIVTAEAT